MTPSARRTQRITAVLTVATAGALGITLYFALTSLPYLASGPSSDERFGRINACLAAAVTQRVAFAVSFDATRATACGPSGCTECTDDGGTRPLAGTGITHVSYDAHDNVWLAARGANGPELLRHGLTGAPGSAPLEAHALLPAGDGVVTLDASGLLTTIDESGAVGASTRLPTIDAKGVRLSVSGDHQRLAAIVGPRVLTYDTKTLALLVDQLPCGVEQGWWLARGHELLLLCGPKPHWALRLDADRGQLTETKQTPPAAPSWPLGDEGPFVTACDGLPCSTSAP